MYDIKPLEEDWKKYRQKKMSPWYLGFFSLLVISIVFLMLFKNKIDLAFLKSYMANTDTVVSVQSEEYQVLLNGALENIETKQNNQVYQSEENKHKNTFVAIPLTDGESKERVHLDIIETNSDVAYEEVEKRFLISQDIDDSLFLAKSYYEKGNYQRAEYWALETNKLDESLEESIFIFVKSKVKLDGKVEAVNMLKHYIKKSDSEEAKNLLYQIQNGTL